MNKVKLSVLSLTLMTLITSCGTNITEKDVDPEKLDESVVYLQERSNSGSTYYSYEQFLQEKYQDNYVSADKKKEQSPSNVYKIDDLKQNGNIANLIDPGTYPDNAGVLMGSQTATYTFEGMPKGRYQLELDYYIPDTFAASALIGVAVDGKKLFTESDSIVLPLEYEDNVSKDENGNKIFDKTKYDDEMSPSVKRRLIWQYDVGLYESTFSTSEPLIFEVEKTNPTISISNLGSEYFYIGNLTLKPYCERMSYNQYSSSKPSGDGLDNHVLNAIDYAYKNSNDTTLANEQSPAVSPYEDGRKLLNVTSGWDQAGQSLSWEVEVESAGWYPMTIHYYNDLDNFPLYRKIEINGDVPFKEVENYEFPTTGSGYKNETLKDENGTPYKFYLNKGVNTVTLTASISPLMEVYNNLMYIYNDINDFAIQIRKITGSAVDANRTYKLTEYFSETEKILQSYKIIIQDSYNKLNKFVGNDKSSSSLTYFQRMGELIDDFIEEPDDLPLNLNKFSSGDSCLAKLIADTATQLQGTTMILDTIYLTNDETQIKKENASWISSFWSSLVTLGQTFTSDKYKTILREGELNIWSSRPQSYNDILQTYADNVFTKETGIRVNIRQMPSEDNLIYAYAANTVPDLVLGVNSGRAFEFALRGDAAFPLSDFSAKGDGWGYEWKYSDKKYSFETSPYYWDLAENMPHGQLMSMLYNDKFYSIPESTSAQLMFSRDDIMNVIGDKGGALELPNTWDELTGILPRIQSYGMNFYYPTSASGSLKGLASTAQFILQNNGTILDETGFNSNFRDPKTYSGLKLLTDLYTINSLPTEVGSFYNHFRYGTYPLGIGDVGMYVQLKYVAPELLGKWSVHQIPGTVQQPQEDGTYKDLNHDGTSDDVSRWYISNGSAAMIFKNSKMIDEAWLFLQWWMSTEIQTRFTEALQATFGPSVVWFSANLDAAKSLPIDSDVREVALKQVQWIVDLQQIPGQYMLERGLSDIWNSVVFGKSSSGEATGKITIGEAVDLEKVLVDREIQRKMEEFGYYNTDTGTVVTPYLLRNYDWVESCFTNFKSGTKSSNVASPYCKI